MWKVRPSTGKELRALYATCSRNRSAATRLFEERRKRGSVGEVTLLDEVTLVAGWLEVVCVELVP
jgi:hypothetical protein